MKNETKTLKGRMRHIMRINVPNKDFPKIGWYFIDETWGLNGVYNNRWQAYRDYKLYCKTFLK